MVMKCVRRDTCDLRKKKSRSKDREKCSESKKCSDLIREKLGINKNIRLDEVREQSRKFDWIKHE